MLKVLIHLFFSWIIIIFEVGRQRRRILHSKWASVIASVKDLLKSLKHLHITYIIIIFALEIKQQQNYEKTSKHFKINVRRPNIKGLGEQEQTAC